MLAARGDRESLHQVIAQVGERWFGLREAFVAPRPPADTFAVPLGDGHWLVSAAPPGVGEEELDCFVRLAGIYLSEAEPGGDAGPDHKAVLARLEELEEHLEQASRREWVAAERLRIARELHDRVAQTLFALGLKAEWLAAHLDRDEHLRPEINRVKELATQGLRQVRETIFSLSSGPVEAAQFRTAVQKLLLELESAGIAGELHTWGDLQRLPPEVTDALYQVIREALINVRRHANASTTMVSVRMDEHEVTAVVQDDGQGPPPGVLETFRESGAHLGLRGMESRVQNLGGRLDLAPGDECGLVVTAVIPLKGVPSDGQTNSGCDRR